MPIDKQQCSVDRLSTSLNRIYNVQVADTRMRYFAFALGSYFWCAYVGVT